MWVPTRGALVGLGAWVCLVRRLGVLWLVAMTLLLLIFWAVLRGVGKRIARFRFQQVVLHILQMRKKRGQALVDDGRVGRVVRSGEAHPYGGEARNRLQEQLEIVVRRFPCPLRVRR